jgi:hypothetical protein
LCISSNATWPAEKEREFTAEFVLSAHATGVVRVEFEARLEGQQGAPTVIRSAAKEIQIYAPLDVQPKYIELAEGAVYQVTASGGPLLTDAAIQFTVVGSELEEGADG